MNFRLYKADLFINEIHIKEIRISDHYEDNHKDSITDEIIIELISTLNNNSYEPDALDGSFKYFVNDHIELDEKKYKLIWLLEEGFIYVGAVNAYRRK